MPLTTLLILQAIVLRNGDMEAGGDMASAWDGKWIGRGELSAKRDTAEKHSGAASLRIDSKGDSLGQISQFVDAKAGTTVTITGWIKTAGKVKVNVAFQPFASDWSKNEFNQIGYAQSDTGWQKFSRTVTVPAWAARFGVGLLVEGDGQAWLDDVSLSGDSVGKEDKTIPPDVQEPTVPYRGYWPSYPTAWDQTFSGLKGEAARGGKRVVFIGDSITQGWKEEGDKGKEVFDRVFAPLKAINLGIGGDRTNQLLYRIDNGQFDGLAPKLVVLNIGVNNLWSGDLPPEKVADGVTAVIARIRAKLPNAKILNVGILPTQELPDGGTRKKAVAINALLAKRANGKTVVFVDLSKAFLDGAGRLSKEIMPDFLHPNAKGYEIYAAALAPKVRALLK